jgi:hypothetical protein
VVAVGVRRSRGRGPTDDTDRDASERAARGCSVLCVSSVEEERGKKSMFALFGALK